MTAENVRVAVNGYLSEGAWDLPSRPPLRCCKTEKVTGVRTIGVSHRGMAAALEGSNGPWEQLQQRYQRAR
jgi:hypothetical protein